MMTTPDDTPPLEERCAALLRALDLPDARDIRAVRPLGGGVASDIAAVETAVGRYCLKFALPKLKVAAEWRAPVRRNAAEYAWLAFAARIAPDNAVRLHGCAPALHGFAMELVEGADVSLWKTDILADKPPDGEAARVGDLLGRLHAASARADFDRRPFDNRADFHALRIEPYLLFTAARVPEHAAALRSLAAGLDAGDRVLVHGDVSPKNILLRGGVPVLLDAECATMGDACFDPAFCLTHLALKALHRPAMRGALLGAMGGFRDAYAAHATWEDAAALEARVCRLLPALMLARVDGKSPVEYLDADARDRVRALGGALLRDPAETVAEVAARLRGAMEGEA